MRLLVLLRSYLCLDLCSVVSSEYLILCFFFFKQKTAYEMRISDWSSDVCSSDLRLDSGLVHHVTAVVDQAILAVGGVRVERDVADQAQLGVLRLDRKSVV